MDRTRAEELFLRDGYIKTGRISAALANVDYREQSTYEKTGRYQEFYWRSISARHCVKKEHRFLLSDIRPKYVGKFTSGESLLFHGSPGNGKTSVAFAALFEMSLKYPGYVEWVSWYDLLEIISSAAAYDEDAVSALQAYGRAEVLLLDDVGRTNVTTDTRAAGLFNLIGKRSGRTTIYTTNIENNAKFVERLGEALGSRIWNSACTYEFKGANFRTPKAVEVIE